MTTSDQRLRNYVGGRIKRRREELLAIDPVAYRQDTVADALGMRSGATAVSRWEQGHVLPRRHTLERLAEYLGVSVAYFLPTPAAENVDDGASSARLAELRELVERVERKVGRLLERRGTKSAMSLDEAAAALARLAADGQRVLRAAEQRGRSVGRQ